jgi:error-prone DNA polymerase
MTYAELQVTTNFSFLRGASHPDELFEEAARLKISALGVVDRNSLAGIVRAYEASKETGVRLVVGCRLDLRDGASVLVYPTDRAAYSRLCRMLSLGKSRAGKGACHLDWDDLFAYSEGLIAIMLPDEADDALRRRLRLLKEKFGDRTYLALTLRRRPNDTLRLHELNNLATSLGVPAVVTNDVLYHVPERRFLQDVVTCIREKSTIDGVGFKRERFADRYLKPPEEMARLFKHYPDALRRTVEIAGRCRFSLDDLDYQYPEEACIPGLTPQQALEKLSWEGAKKRYSHGTPEKVVTQIEHELRLIESLNYAPYFLTVFSIVNFARSKDILCQGRGSAANSAVCYVLGITSVDPERSDLLFERFISKERQEPPDIDVDFEHDRREEVIQWIYETYGRKHAALTAVVIRYRSKAAIRDVGKALGLPEDLTALLSGHVWSYKKDPLGPQQAEELHLNPQDRRLRLALGLAQELRGFPRHLSQHPGGFVLTRDRLDDLVPIEPAAMEDRQVIEWDKDDIDLLKFMKVDVLGLGMLGCLRRVFNLLKEHKGLSLEIASIPSEDPITYQMICNADTVGVFQIESRAQMSMLPRIKPRTFYDLVIEVAIVRPGPIQGDMVHPYLRRREGKEKVEFPTPELKKVLGKTLGIPLFQEQAMNIAIHCAGFTPAESDQLRRAMATFKMRGGVTRFKDKLINGMVERGYDRDFAERCFKQLEGFGSYGFPESHAASFALLAYASSWLKCHHPDAFCCAILNAYPMGFYAPAQLVRDAKAHGVEIRPIDVNQSRWDCTMEPSGKRFAVRLGFKLAKGLRNDEAAQLIALRNNVPFNSIEEVKARSGVSTATLECLAEADAFGSMGLDRRSALWAHRGQATERLPLFASADERERTVLAEAQEPHVSLTPMTEAMEVTEDYSSVGLSLKRHPFSFLRGSLNTRGVLPTSALARLKDGSRVQVAGIVLVRQRPMTANNVMFMTLEDEAGHANIIIWPSLFEKQRREIISSRMVVCAGKLQREGLILHVIAENLLPLEEFLQVLGEEAHILRHFDAPSRDFH